jgi:uncharacterized protein (DUF433 family)
MTALHPIEIPSDGPFGPDSDQLLRGGIYTVPEAAALVGASMRQVRGWVSGYGTDRPDALIRNELGRVDGRLALSFANLIEMNFIAFFVRAGINTSVIRDIMSEVRDTLSNPHPFAHEIVFQTDGKKIVARIADKRGLKKIYDLHSKNYEMHDVVFRSLKSDLIYDATGMARAWYPRRRIAPHVVVNPRYSFGAPVLTSRLVPTRAIVDAARSEGGIDDVASLFSIPPNFVREAILFEASLRRIH